MKLLGPMHLILLLLALINMVPAVEAEQSWGIFAIAAASAILSCAYYKWFPGRAFSRWVVFLGVVAAIGYLFYEMFLPHKEATVHIIDLAHFIIFLACCKFFELRTHRDVGVTLLISFLLIVVSAFVSGSIWFGLALAFDVTVGVGWLIAFHTRREIDAVAARRRGVRTPAAKRHDASVASPHLRGIVRTSIFSSAACLMIATLVFVTVPRSWGIGLFGRIHGLVPASVTGLSEVVRLTNNETLEDDSPVMRVRFSQDGRILTNESFEPYMRGSTFSRYFDGAWRRTPRTVTQEIQAGTLASPEPVFQSFLTMQPGQMIRQEVWLESAGQGVLFSIYPPLALGSSNVKRAVLDRRDLAIRRLSGNREAGHYVVYSPAGQMPQPVGRPRSPRRLLRDGWSEIPKRVQEFARSFSARVGDPTDPLQHEHIASKIEAYRASDQFEYTLKQRESQNGLDRVEDFLFENRRGHCQYFASAMTLLCQSVGIPARLANGYHGGEYNEAGGFHRFRERDAHAWVEVFIQNRGWVAFDPTPPSAVSRRESDESLLARSKRLLDYLRFKWSTSVVSFDSEDRLSLVRSFEGWFAKLSRSDGHPESFIATLKALFWGPEFLAVWQRLLYWLVLALSVTFVVLALRVAWILSLMIREYIPGKRPQHRGLTRRSEARFYDRLLLLLANKGHVKDAHTTPREFARRLARAHVDLTDLPELTDWFYEVQYGQRPLSRDRWGRIRSFLQRLREDPSFGAA